MVRETEMSEFVEEEQSRGRKHNLGEELCEIYMTPLVHVTVGMEGEGVRG
jgi:hypothetical protein